MSAGPTDYLRRPSDPPIRTILLAVIVAAGLLLGRAAPVCAQSSPDVTAALTASSDAGDTQDLTLGIDPNATTGIDPALGEEEQPPRPPSSVFDARLIDDDISASGLGEGLVVDIRPGTATFTGTKRHEIQLQPGDDATEITISWTLPAGVTGQLEDVVTDGDEVSAAMSGSGSLTLTNLNLTKLTVTLDYQRSLTTTDDTYTTTEDQTLQISDPAAGVLDDDSGSGSLTASLETGPAHGTLTLHADGTFTYTPSTHFNGTDTFTYRATDAAGANDTATVSIDVSPVNDAPVVRTSFPDRTLTARGAPLPLTNLRVAFHDPDGDVLTVSAISSRPSVLSVAGVEDGVELRPKAAGTASVAVTASDGDAETSAAPFEVTVEPPGEDETPTDQASAVVDTSRGTTTVDLGTTGALATFRGVRTRGTVQFQFFTGRSKQASPKTDATGAFEHVSPYRWESESTVAFDAVDVRFRLADGDVTGVGAPSATVVLVDSTGDDHFVKVPTRFDDGGSPTDSTDDALIAQDLTALGTFRLASNHPANPLPVELTAFTATVDASRVVLHWRTASETTNAGFEVQHRVGAPERGDADDWTEIGFVEGAGTTTEPQHYRFHVPDLTPGTHRFRLRQVDVGGTATRTEPVSVTVKAEHALSLDPPGPNPVRRSTQFVFTVPASGRVTVALYNVLGQHVQTLYDRPATPGQRHAVELSTDGLPSGTYFVRLSAPTGTRTRRIVVLR